MTGTTAQIVNSVGPVLLCVLVGYGIAWRKLPFDNKVIGSLVANVGYPTLIISHLSAQHVALGAFFEFLLASVASVAAFGAIGFVFLRLVGLPWQSFLSPMMLNNVGNVGLPVAILAFGNAGLAYSIAFLVVVMTGIFTVAIWLPQGRVTAGGIVGQPSLWAVAIAILLLSTDTKLPTVLDHTFSILGGLAIPLMLLTLGHTLATLQPGGLWRGVWLTAFHQVMAAAVALGLVTLFGFTGAARGVFVLMCMMPASVATYLWVDMYRPDDAPDVAAFILVSTLSAALVLPLVLAVWV